MPKLGVRGGAVQGGILSRFNCSVISGMHCSYFVQ